jgi:hypothetical protein
MTKVENVEVKNEVVAVKDTNEVNLFSGMAAKTYCSKNVVSDQDKKELFNALEQCDVVLNDIVGQEIVLKDVYCEEKQVMDDVSGELKTKYRTILFDIEGKTYATGSYGIFNVVKKLSSIYGLPTWEDGIKVKVAKRPMGNGKSTLTLNLL